MNTVPGAGVRAIRGCRICGNPRLSPLLDLGVQALTGVFPASPDMPVTAGPLQLVRCSGSGPEVCGLVQLAHSYDLGEMYGDNYGYRSGLNPAMVRHLHAKVAKILNRLPLGPGDLVIDVGSNDGTTLSAYPASLQRVGVDPTAGKFAHYYPEGSRYIADFFDGQVLARNGIGQRARVVTSFSMFYDLEAPLQFMQAVYDCLDDEGLWVFEQSYLPSMLDTNSYDTVCHEHLEYYALRQVKWMADRIGFVLVDVEFNDVNGGSFSVTASKSAHAREAPIVAQVLAEENRRGLHTDAPYLEFRNRVDASRQELLAFLGTARLEGKRVAALGASTKGNVLLQFCGLGAADIEVVAEVNVEKFGRFTPGTFLPIRAQDEVLASAPDYLLVLPWHFRRFFLDSPLFKAHTLVFPLPRLDVVPPRSPEASVR